jgi:preprotein translocase subunit SecG
MSAMRRSGGLLVKIAAPAALLALVLAPAAYASNDGRGFYGATNDKVVTNAGFIVIGFFVLFVLFMSLLQGRLERRKEQRKAAAKAQSSSAHLRGGW